MKKLLILLTALLSVMPMAAKKQKVQSDREYWAALAYKMAQPVLENMSK